MLDFDNPGIDNLAMAIVLAAVIHDGQTDRSENDYILHPLRLMNKMDTNEERICAVLHDVIEDCEDAELEDLKEFFSENIINTVDVLTHKEEDTYFEYIQKIIDSDNKIALKIKEEDIIDNMNLKRLPIVRESDIERNKKYAQALRMIRLRSNG